MFICTVSSRSVRRIAVLATQARWLASSSPVPRLPSNTNNNCIQRRSSRFVYNLLAAPRTVSNTYAQVAKAQSCENHVQHIERLSRATCCVPLGTKGQLSNKVWQSWNRIYFSLTLWAETINRWRREGNRSTRRKPMTTSFRKCHILKARKFNPRASLEPAQ